MGGWFKCSSHKEKLFIVRIVLIKWQMSEVGGDCSAFELRASLHASRPSLRGILVYREVTLRVANRVLSGRGGRSHSFVRNLLYLRGRREGW